MAGIECQIDVQCQAPFENSLEVWKNSFRMNYSFSNKLRPFIWNKIGRDLHKT